jgi:DNA-directed RNA polymerase specialized sigma24 family protein
VALSAFDSFCRGASKGHFPQLTDRDDLWQVLVLLTARKAYRLRKHEGRQKRGGGEVRHFSELTDEEAGVVEVIGREPAPEFAAQVAEECRLRLQALSDEGLRAVALAKLEGYTNAEVASKLGVAKRTVERRLTLIRTLWREEESLP